ncbi:MAG: DUF2203 domain-containing protein [Blastocatellia bacterium]|nr:DUF2203 domain-containing protein [Blastocatellia bacterium]MCS7157792.1 DUF2203 domain-containing protein [Blastocatellia bacterium]MCX7753305.1 DUF2203 domain-containing protein [Blastocatellia bacterium]MDW8168133.1 DUF2203 domain-containing protein [Acidobacteriota bacterium]MDW8257620.1 DUF2203 domain-containing protein [Acidobacteriota bacterium]
MRHERYFSIEEAERALARWRAEIERMAELARTLAARGFDVSAGHYRPGFHPDQLGPYPPEFVTLSQIVARLHREGILVKGLEDGLVDFPHRRPDGEEVYLCWRVGEPRLAYWHPLDTGFAGRRPLEQLR